MRRRGRERQGTRSIGNRAEAAKRAAAGDAGVLRSYVGRHGVAPSRQEVADALGLKHRSTADMHLSALVKKGWIALRANQPRYIRLLHEELPVVGAGAVARETQTLAEERIIAMVPRAVGEQFEPAAEFLVQLEDESLSASRPAAGRPDRGVRHGGGEDRRDRRGPHGTRDRSTACNRHQGASDRACAGRRRCCVLCVLH